MSFIRPINYYRTLLNNKSCFNYCYIIEKNNKVCEIIKIGETYNEKLTPNLYIYNSDECCNLHENNHKKIILRFLSKVRIECECGGWCSFNYIG